MDDKDLKSILHKTFIEIYSDLEELADIAKKGKPSMEKRVEEIEQRCKQNILAIEIQMKIK
ncbi:MULTISPECIES: transcriptional regulator DegR [unclassified Bacillus (in: firmicutes)]|uniref:transcriptional regulator DegR n=1 Tax=unclassified Bacillus (in: firmicutes) TaxID=185979 RepID=UPI00227E1CE3|nr:transcriptional regulator DegR [Bacillus sp. S20C3]MCY8203223.1 transcriptional regulator DegR [Bacillus sp. N12A5]MCY8289066.1 transcriptional regulator DegR [Bacillus sp. N13C7]MCY8638936.1 transcriptional regulator DegR [Bacillus sp. S17B2]MCY8720630.1 transcriptional regulator DegR [Bacillus sp. S10C12M]MCY9143947.1 transcriptional regulator DegR [Bacillus sp. T9C1]